MYSQGNVVRVSTKIKQMWSFAGLLQLMLGVNRFAEK